MAARICASATFGIFAFWAAYNLRDAVDAYDKECAILWGLTWFASFLLQSAVWLRR